MASAQTHDSPILFVIFLVFAGAVVLFTIFQARRRTQGLTDVAERMGFIFEGTHWSGPMLSPRFKTTIVQRTRGQFSNALVGSYGGLQVSLCDYSYGQGKGRTRLTLACFSQDAELPPFALRTEGFFDKIGDAITHSDINFDSHPEFSRRYHLRSPNETRIRLLFSPSLLTYFEQIPPDKKWCVEASGPTLIIYTRTYLRIADISLAGIPNFLSETSGIARTILNSERVRAAAV